MRSHYHVLIFKNGRVRLTSALREKPFAMKVRDAIKEKNPDVNVRLMRCVYTSIGECSVREDLKRGYAKEER